MSQLGASLPVLFKIMTLLRRRHGFTLLEIVVVLGIIACLLALVIPFYFRMREGGRTGKCAQNLQRIGKAIAAYAKEHQDQLPGPLSTDQYPVASAGSPPRDGQLLKHIASYLNAPGDEEHTAESIFTFPAWQRNSDRTTDSPVFLANNEVVQPFDQPIWGGSGKAPLKTDQLGDLKHGPNDHVTSVAASHFWVLTEADRELATILKLQDPWVQRMPPKALHYDHRNALYLDWHVDNLVF